MFDIFVHLFPDFTTRVLTIGSNGECPVPLMLHSSLDKRDLRHIKFTKVFLIRYTMDTLISFICIRI